MWRRGRAEPAPTADPETMVTFDNYVRPVMVSADMTQRGFGRLDFDKIKEKWKRCWLCLNDLAIHGVIMVAITLIIFLAHSINHGLSPPDGLILVEAPTLNIKVPLDWGFAAGELAIIVRFVIKSFHILENL
jgi:hypothetical protein